MARLISMVDAICDHWPRVRIYDISDLRVSEIAMWLKEPEILGRYTMTSTIIPSHQQLRLVNGMIRPAFIYGFENPDTAFAFKIRWA